jgi:hypothetical protein
VILCKTPRTEKASRDERAEEFAAIGSMMVVVRVRRMCVSVMRLPCHERLRIVEATAAKLSRETVGRNEKPILGRTDLDWVCHSIVGEM